MSVCFPKSGMLVSTSHRHSNNHVVIMFRIKLNMELPRVIPDKSN